MGYWKFIRPEATTNLFTDPSFELADPDTQWDIVGDGVGVGFDWTQSTDYRFKSRASATATLGTSAHVTVYQTITTTATSYTLSAYVQRTAGGAVTNAECVAWFDDGAHNWDSITHVGGNWYYCVYTAAATAAANQFGIRALEATLRVDAVQLENKAYPTTFCDGEQEGCYWTGAPYTSTSTRSAQSRAGGRVMDFEDDYSFHIIDWQGWGVPPHRLNLDSYAILPGAQLNSIKTDVSLLTLTGYFGGSSLSNLHTLRQALVEEMAHDRYPATGEGWQPIRVRYTGATVHKEAMVFYDSGMEGSGMLRKAFTETMPVRFLMADPFWYGLGDNAATLDPQDTETLRYCAGRLLSTGGMWGDLGLAANPGGGGRVWAICAASDGSVYFGGTWTDWNTAGVGGDYAIRFTPATETWSVLVGASDLNGTVYDIKEGPDGTIYLCGAFDSVDGDGTKDNIVAYNPVANTWASLGDPDTTNITLMRAMAFDSTGRLYVVGDFTAVGGVANTAYIAMYDWVTWQAVGTPSVAAGYPYCIAIDAADNVYIGGTFTDFDAVAAADYLAVWNGAAWADLGSGTQTGSVYDLAFAADGTLYLCGSFTNQGGDADCDYICAWDGQQFLPLVGTDPPTATFYSLEIAPDGRVFAAGCRLGPAEMASWNGYAWEFWDTSAGAVVVEIGRVDPVVPTNYDIWVGDDASAATFIGGDSTVANNGTAAQYPVIHWQNNAASGCWIYTIGNETTGKRLMLYYYLLAGEELVIDLRPGQKSITSSMYGPRPGAILPNCDFGTFALQPGDNQITCFSTTGAPASTPVWMQWRDAYRGMD